MQRAHRVRYEMFGRVRNFGIANRSAFPESSAAGQKFGQLAVVVDEIESHLTRRTQGLAEARRVNAATRAAVIGTMKAIASTGKQATAGEPGPNPFRFPRRGGIASVLAGARYFMEEAGRRQERFAELGMSPTFVADLARQVEALEGAIALQQDSRAARRKATTGIASGIARGSALVASLDVIVTNAVRPDPVRLGEWLGARSVDDGPSSGPSAKPEGEAGATPAATPKEVLQGAS